MNSYNWYYNPDSMAVIKDGLAVAMLVAYEDVDNVGKLMAAAPKMYELLKYFVSGQFTAEDVGSAYHWACDAGRKLIAQVDREA